jgi:hypothetical protein
LESSKINKERTYCPVWTCIEVNEEKHYKRVCKHNPPLYFDLSTAPCHRNGLNKGTSQLC